VSESGDSRAEILAKMAQSRAEIRLLLEPAQHGAGADQGGRAAHAGGGNGQFPRSRTMQLLLSGRGVGTVGAVVGGLLMARPALAIRLVRMIPLGAVARMLLVKGITALRARHE
jgi:hypothetical protein